MIDDWGYPAKTEGIRWKIYDETAAYPQIGRCGWGPWVSFIYALRIVYMFMLLKTGPRGQKNSKSRGPGPRLMHPRGPQKKTKKKN